MILLGEKREKKGTWLLKHENYSKKKSCVCVCVFFKVQTSVTEELKDEHRECSHTLQLDFPVVKILP